MTPDQVDELAALCKELALHDVHRRLEDLDDETRAVLHRVLHPEILDRQRRGLERRRGTAKLGHFKPIADFDWTWPTKVDRAAVADLMQLRFLGERSNVVLAGPNGIGKSMIAKNVAHAALLAGHTVRFVCASDMLADLSSHDGPSVLARRLRMYVQPSLLCIDELGYLSYGNRYADLLFEVVNRRYEKRSTLITTNKRFREWTDVFPNAACVVTLVDRLTHHCDVIDLDGDSYRAKEAEERRQQQQATRSERRPEKSTRKR